ncbi:MAG TPA: YihY/virulence factor BrkB family protein [Terriglobales bacterium]|nr:YihY/virulence factor BrkB family protein [Terriglobales bacterium]
MERPILKRAFALVCRSIWEYDLPRQAAALSYYLVLSLFPGIILFVAVVNAIHVHGLLAPASSLLLRLLPAETVVSFQSVLFDVLPTNGTVWFSFGTVGTIWVASSAFAALIEALDMAYGVKVARPFWKARALALGLAAASGTLLMSVLAVMIAGPRFGSWLAMRVNLPPSFPLFWAVFHWMIVFGFTLAAVEMLYFLAPNVKQRFEATLPGAMLAVLSCIGLSYLFAYYVRHVGNFSHIYGTLAGFIAFMVWCYWNSFVLLVGAKLNAELAAVSPKGPVLPKPVD